MSASTDLDSAFAALAHPARRAILARLAQGEATVNDLAEPFDMSLPAVSRHIHVLENAGLISRRRDAQFRHCRLEIEPLRVVSAWADQYRHIWEGRFDVMNDIIEAAKGGANG